MKKIFTIIVALFWAPLLFADDDIGIFETMLESKDSFSLTTQALEQAIGGSELVLQATHDVRVPDNKHKARLFVLTSPAYVEAAANTLTNPQLDPYGKIPEFKFCAVKVEAAPS